MWIKYLFLILCGLGAGAGLAGGFFALIIALGIISRFAHQTRTAKYILLYEDAVALGGCLGTFWYLFEWEIPLGWLWLLVYGSFAGIFVGAWAMALTEIIDTIPVFMRRIYLRKGLAAAVWALALGHSFGALIYYFVVA